MNLLKNIIEKFKNKMKNYFYFHNLVFCGNNRQTSPYLKLGCLFCLFVIVRSFELCVLQLYSWYC